MFPIIGGIGYVQMNADLYDYMNAVPPKSFEAPESGEPALKEFVFNKVDPTSKRASVKPNSSIVISGSSEMIWTDWGVTSLPDAMKLQSKSRAVILKEFSKPAPRVRVDIVRRSWLEPGEIVVCSQIAHINKKSGTEGTWSLKVIAPEKTGTYRVRIFYGEKRSEYTTPISSAHLVAVFNMTVEE